MERKIRALLIDDDQGDFEMTRAMVAEIEAGDVSLDWVATFEEGLDALEDEAFDVYLVDYFLEDHTGMDLLLEARERGIRAPMIMLTGRGNRAVDVQAMNAGAADYLVKGKIDPELLERSIRFAIERTRAQEELRASEARQRGIVDHMPLGLFRTTLDGHLLDANPALFRILGFPSREELADRYAGNLFVSVGDKDRFRDDLDVHGIVRGFESELEGADGDPVRIRNTARVHRDADGEVEYVEGFLEDVSDSRDARALAISRARFDAVFEEAESPIAVVGADGSILESNGAFERIFPRPGAEPVPSLVDLAMPEERAELLGLVQRLSRGDLDRYAGEHAFTGRDGSEVRLRTTIRPAPDGSGRTEELVVLLEGSRD